MKIQKMSLFFLSLFFLVLINCGEKEEKKGEPQLEIKVKTTEKIRFLYLENTGSYAELGPAFGQLMQYSMGKGISGMPMGIFYDDPFVVPEESLRCEIGIPVSEDFEPDAPFKVKEIPSQEVAYAVLKGPYEKIAGEYGKITAWAQEEGYTVVGPVMEIYLEGGEGVPESEFVTEVRFPVAKGY